MMRWTRVFIEIYDVSGYTGRWEGTPDPGRGGWDPNDLPALAKRIRENPRYRNATLHYCEEGRDLIIGVFDGVKPPSGPKKGQPFVPDTFEEHM